MAIQALYSGASGMIAQNKQLDTIANNLANVSTDGFKKTRANFEDLLYRVVKVPGAGVPGGNETPGLGLQFGVGTRVSSTQLDFSPGNLESTNRQLDVAIQGPGFFLVQDGQGNEFYTRAGNFTLDDTGNLIMATASKKYFLQPQVTLPQDSTSIIIGADGSVAVTQPNNPAPAVQGQLTAVRFQNPEGLLPIGDNLYQESNSSGPANQGNFAQNEFGSVAQGFLETSNVEPVQELIDLITSQRSFELNSQVIQTADDNLQTVTRLRS